MSEWIDQFHYALTRSHPAALRLDMASSTLGYIGMARVGTAEDEANWQIRKMALTSDGDVTITYADGDDFFDNVWDDRAGLSYS
jgi:hypothetical protein